MSRKGHPNELGYVYIDDVSLNPSAPAVTGDLVNVANFVWDTNALTWVKQTQSGGGGGGGPVTIADGADVAQGSTGDAPGANTVIGQLKQIAAAGPGGSGAGSVNVLNQVHVIVDSGGGAGAGSVNVINQVTALITGTPTVLQGGAPWQVNGSVAATQGGTWNVGINGTPTVLQGNAPWQVAGSIAATQGGIWNVGINSPAPVTPAQFGFSSATLGQKTMAASVPVAIASDQSAIPVSFSPSGTPSSTFVAGAFGSVNVLNSVTTVISGVPTVDVRSSGLSSVSVVGNVNTIIGAGTASMGSVNVGGGTIQIVSGGNTLGSVNVGGGVIQILTGTNVMGSVNVTSATARVIGGTAAGDPLTANPIPDGGRAMWTNPVQVDDGDVVARATDKLGKIVTSAFSPRQLGLQMGSTTSGTGETTFLTAGSTGVFHDLTFLTLSNLGSLSTPTVFIRDQTGGPIIFRETLGAFETLSINFTRPWEQSLAANAWTMQLSVGGGSVFVAGQVIKVI